jgi:outer membrane protein OmpU
MKKILLTTSALTLLAGAAAADVSVGGYARIGISNSSADVSATDTTKVGTHSYLRNQITFSGSATTDGGLTLGTWTRYRHSAGASKFAGTGAFSAPRISISNGAMTLTAGNAGGAINANSGMWGCGSVMWGCSDVVGSWDWASTSSTGTGPNVVRLDMALGGASVSVSGGNDNDTEASVSMSLGGGSVGIGYDAGSATAAAAAVAGALPVAGTLDASADATPLDTTDDAVGVYTAGTAGASGTATVAEAAAQSTISINYSGTVGGLGVGVRMSQSNSKTGYMANVSAPMGAGSVYVFAGKTLGQTNNYGLRYNQSLGGGASMQAGMTSSGGDTTVGAGVAFGF